MTEPSTLLDAVMAGSRRVPLPLPDLEAQDAARLGEEPSALAVLSLARVILRAGRVPRELTAPCGQAPEETRAQAGADLEDLLVAASGSDDLLELWLRCAALAGLDVPHARWPLVLARSEASERVLHAAMDLPSARRDWLAGLNPSWKRLVPMDVLVTPSAWAEMTPTQRSHAAKGVLAQDPDLLAPLLARLPELDASARVSLLDSLRDPVPSWEPALEALLEGRSREAGAAAAEVLGLLEHSRLSVRAASYVPKVLARRGLVRPRLDLSGYELDDEAKALTLGFAERYARTPHPELARLALLAPWRSFSDASQSSPKDLVKHLRASAKEGSPLARGFLDGLERKARRDASPAALAWRRALLDLDEDLDDDDLVKRLRAREATRAREAAAASRQHWSSLSGLLPSLLRTRSSHALVALALEEAPRDPRLALAVAPLLPSTVPRDQAHQALGEHAHLWDLRVRITEAFDTEPTQEKR